MARLKAQFGKRLQTLRSRAGITQEKLADELGITVESVSNMERGIHGPRFDTLERITEILHIPAKALFEFEEE